MELQLYGMQAVRGIVGITLAFVCCALHGCGRETGFYDSGSLVDRLNQDFVNPPSSDGIPGVLTRYVELKGGDQDMYRGCGSCDQGYNKADCKKSTASINAKYSVFEDQVHVFQTPKPNPMAIGGLYIFDTNEIQSAVRCSYARDGGADSRYNFGCGCPARQPDPVKFDDNACVNQWADESIDIDACHCESVDQQIDKPDEATGLPYWGGCYWRGPAFYSGQGKGSSFTETNAEDEIASFTAMRSKVAEMGLLSNTLFKWNEIVLDNSILDSIVSRALVAIAVGVGNSKTGVADATTIQHARDLGRKIVGFDIPVIGFDDSNLAAPFSELPENGQGEDENGQEEDAEDGQ